MIFKSSRDKRLIIIPKTITEVVNNSAVLQDDNELFLANIPADSAWEWQLYLKMLTSATADMRVNMVVPVGTIETAYIDQPGNIRTYGTNFFIAGSGVEHVFWMRGAFQLVGGGGTFKFQWAQQTAEVSDTFIYNTSNLIMHRLW